MKYDLAKILIDHENEQNIIYQSQKHNYLRYSLINTVIGFLANINHHAAKFKQWPLVNPYYLAALNMVTKIKSDNLQIDIDNETVYRQLRTVCVGVHNSKLGGSGIVLSPYSIVNDGLIDSYILTKESGFIETLSMVTNLKKH